MIRALYEYDTVCCDTRTIASKKETGGFACVAAWVNEPREIQRTECASSCAIPLLLYTEKLPFTTTTGEEGEDTRLVVLLLLLSVCTCRTEDLF